MSDRGEGASPPRRLDGLRPPEPPAELRTRTVAAAAATLESGVDDDVWTRLWTSRPLRLAWAAVVAALVLAHVAVTPRPRLAVSVDRLPVAATADQLGGELDEIARLPRIEPGALARLP